MAKRIRGKHLTEKRAGHRFGGSFLAEALMSVDDVDFDFENSQFRVVVTRELPETARMAKLSSTKVGQEVEVPYWTAKELVQLGYARFREEDVLNYNSLSKIHWRETIPASRQLPALQANFYCLLRRHLAELHQKSKQDQVKLRELERSESLVRDIVNCRLRKIVSIAASPTPSEELIQGLSYEERVLYSTLNETIENWKSKLLGQELKA
jgi:DNA replication factor GINS